jgi:small-conductance mechanosensitive channel
MSIKEFLKKRLLEFCIITTCVTAVTAVLGLIISPEDRFGYDSFFSPLLFGLLSLVPSIVTYSRKELSYRQTVIRKVLHLLLLEATLTVFALCSGMFHAPADIALFAVSVFIVYLLVHLIKWFIDRKEADEINRTLKTLQGKNE